MEVDEVILKCICQFKGLIIAKKKVEDFVPPDIKTYLEKGMATHSSILAWRIPWTEEPGGLQSMGSQESDTTKLLSTAQHIKTYHTDIVIKTIHNWNKDRQQNNRIDTVQYK